MYYRGSFKRLIHYLTGSAESTTLISLLRFVMKPLLLSLLVAVGGLNAQQNIWQPSPGHTQVPIWPGHAPDQKPVAGPEDATPRMNDISNVTVPTMTVYSPAGKNTGAAVVVFPGGGYEDLAIVLEGTEVCDWLITKGITCVLLKYRVTAVGPYPRSGPYPESPMALEDAQRAMGLLRLNAAKWQIDPHKIGVLGFSAGGHLVAAISTHFDKRLYPPVDEADNESCRPDFAVALYPGHLTIRAAISDARHGPKKFVVQYPENADIQLGLNPEVPVTSRTPPTFLVQAEDDPVDSVNNSLAYYIALKNAGVPVEMHLYAHGGHAFGLRRTKFPITEWPQLVERWLRTIGMTSE